MARIFRTYCFGKISSSPNSTSTVGIWENSSTTQNGDRGEQQELTISPLSSGKQRAEVDHITITSICRSRWMKWGSF